MGRFFDSRAEMEDAIDKGTDPNQPLEQKILVASGEAGQPVALLLGLRLAAKQLEEEFGGHTGNEVHDMTAASIMREPLAKLNLAIAEVIEGAKEVTWQGEICTCKQCRGGRSVKGG